MSLIPLLPDAPVFLATAAFFVGKTFQKRLGGR